MLTRDPAVIKAVPGATGDKPGQFDRDQSPMAGIVRQGLRIKIIKVFYGETEVLHQLKSAEMLCGFHRRGE